MGFNATFSRIVSNFVYELLETESDATFKIQFFVIDQPHEFLNLNLNVHTIEMKVEN